MKAIEGWKTCIVRDICDLGRGRVINGQEIERNPGVFPVYSSQSSNNGKMGSIDTYDFDGEYVTWTTDGAYAGTVFYRSGKFNCTNVCGTLRAKEPDIFMLFIAYKLSTLAKHHVSYVGNPKLMNGVMANIKLLIPTSKPEQAKIAEILSTVDRAIEQTEALIAKQQRIKTGLMQDLLTRGIDENGNLRSEQTHKFKDSPLGRIPVEWEVKRLDDLLVEKRYGISTSLSDEPEGIPVLRMNNLVNGEVDYTSLKYSRRKDALKLCLNDDDVLFNRTNSIDYVGRTGIYRYSGRSVSFASYLVRLVTDSEKFCAGYLNLWLNDGANQIRVKQLATIGVQQANVNPTNLGALSIAFPKTIAEQKSILSSIASASFAICNIVKSLQKFRSLKTALMQDLLTGKKRVTPLLKDSEVVS